MPPSLQIYDAQVANYFANRTEESAKQLASLINGCSDSLDIIFNPIFHQLYIHSFNQITAIDSLIQFLVSISNHINSSVHDGGAEDRRGRPFRKPSSGPETLAERLSRTLYKEQWIVISRNATPGDEERDKELDLYYYQAAAVHGTILARAFAIQSDLFRDRLWREVEDVFVKGVFSGDPEPGVYVVIAALLLGAGNDIRAYLNNGHAGKGKGWVWYKDECSESEDTWRWSDIAKTVKSRWYLPETLPEYVTSSFELARDVINKRQGNWDSDTLARKGFPWA